MGYLPEPAGVPVAILGPHLSHFTLRDRAAWAPKRSPAMLSDVSTEIGLSFPYLILSDAPLLRKFRLLHVTFRRCPSFQTHPVPLL